MSSGSPVVQACGCAFVARRPHSGRSGGTGLYDPGGEIVSREGEQFVVRAVARFQLNLTIAVRSRAIEIATGGLRPGGPLRARGSSASIGTAQARMKPACNCARTSLIQSASADCCYQPWNSFRGGRAVAPGRPTVCQIHLERRNSAHDQQTPATRTNSPTQCLIPLGFAPVLAPADPRLYTRITTHQ